MAKRAAATFTGQPGYDGWNGRGDQTGISTTDSGHSTARAVSRVASLPPLRRASGMSGCGRYGRSKPGRSAHCRPEARSSGQRTLDFLRSEAHHFQMADILVVDCAWDVLHGDARIEVEKRKTGFRMLPRVGLCPGYRRLGISLGLPSQQIADGLADRSLGCHRMGPRHGVEVVGERNGEPVQVCTMVLWC